MPASGDPGDATAATALAAYAAGLSFEDLPAEVVARAKDCISDSIGVMIGGADDPTGRIASGYLKSTGTSGRSVVLDGTGTTLNAGTAALLNGLSSHAIEFDCLRKPGAGVHGAPVVAAALAVAQQTGADGRALIAAVVAAIEVMFRIGTATHHSCETRGFHAPGLTGPFGAAVAAGHLMGLDADRMARALGICGSLSSGLLEFARSGDGSMVKKLHLGRAAESGILAAGLAEAGFTGPLSVLEGDFGFLSVYCEESEAPLLTAGLGSEYEVLKLCCKRYPCHITAHAPIEAALALKQRLGISERDIAGVVVEGSKKMASLHNIPEPSDSGLARYSIPFCVAVALTGDPGAADSFSLQRVSDPVLLDLSRRIDVRPFPEGSGHGSWAANVTIRTAGGSFSQLVEDVPGSPGKPFDAAQRRAKFLTLTQDLCRGTNVSMFERLEVLEEQIDTGWIGL